MSNHAMRPAPKLQALSMEAGPAIYLPHVQPMMQSTLRALADLDFAHDASLEALEASNLPASIKKHMADTLVAQHAERREPYLLLLQALQAEAFARTRSAA